MQLAKVIGTVVATQKTATLTGVKLMIVQKLTHDYQPSGEPFVAIDGTHQAGPDDIVLLEGGREAALAVSEWFNPADQAILAIVDVVDARPLETPKKASAAKKQ